MPAPDFADILPELVDQADQILPLPDLAEIQIKSYQWFLDSGLRELLDHFSPIEDYSGTVSIMFGDYRFAEPVKNVEECRKSDSTYEMSLYVKVRLVNKETADIKESEVYLGEVPRMTDRGTFIVNGSERVVISQLTRSPGVYFRDLVDASGRVLHASQIIPAEGPWTEIDNSADGVISVKIGQTRKFPATILLRALQWFDDGSVQGVPATGTETEILDYFGTRRRISLRELLAIVREQREATVTGAEPRSEFYSLQRVEDSDGHLVIDRYRHMDPEKTIPLLRRAGVDDIDVLEVPFMVHATLRADRDQSVKDFKEPSEMYIESGQSLTAEHGLLSLYLRMRPGERLSSKREEALPTAEQLVRSFFFDLRRYDLSRVGRYKVNRRLNLDVSLDNRSLTRADLIAILDYLVGLHKREGKVDDIDHLQNKRVRAVGELVQNQLRIGFLRMERVAKERMASSDADSLVPHLVISVKPIQAAVNSFFGSGQLSQFMDQVNPLSELAHKRRLSAMGPGGLSRQSAKLEVRDVHHSHYGRICPIETPEGANVGLIGYLALYAQLDEFGFIRTPYRRVVNGRLADEPPVFLGPDEDEEYNIASASEPRDARGRFTHERVTVRRSDEFPTIKREDVNLCDLSAKQVFSIATALIPFLENCDAVRALAGSNMQRQAVPLVSPEPPIVGTGLEERAALDSGTVITSPRRAKVVEADAAHVVLEFENGERKEHNLQKFTRTNMSTCLNQRPVVRKGQRVERGSVVADGAATSQGRLALGRNLIVAYLSWEGYNFEDAVVVSERVVKEDLLTSIHVEKYECEARDTKLGPEEITRDIPNVGEEALKDLDDQGVVRVGAEVKAEDILVGKVAPKGQAELTAEERLVIAIFGKKAEEMRDVSLRVPHGSTGIVIGSQVFSRHKYQCRECGAIFGFGKTAEFLECERCGGRLKKLQGDDLKPGVNQMVRVFVAQRRKLQVGDKVTGRHGNKGVVARIVPVEDMPYLPDGTPVDVCLNPLSVPSRMNLGQLLEVHLGYLGHRISRFFRCPVFESYKFASIKGGLEALEERMRIDALRDYATWELNFLGEVCDLSGLADDVSLGRLEATLLKQLAAADRETLGALAEWLGIPQNSWKRADADKAAALILDQSRANSWDRVLFVGAEGKHVMIDGHTGEPYNMPVAVGSLYILKLNHLVEDKIHARSTGPYSLITQQPLGGKAQMGGQRFGEMEVWALEAYGASYALQEMLTIKSDDVRGRVETYEAIVKGENIREPGVPESFKILVREMQSLALDVTVEDREGNPIDLTADGDDVR
jgi:DNA-directed RNA polymerase subunit beta